MLALNFGNARSHATKKRERMEHPRRNDTWASGAAYEPYVGRWSRLVAREFLAWLAIPQGARWLDIGCGPGALSQSILDVASPREITGIDPSERYITFARQQVRDWCFPIFVNDMLRVIYNGILSGMRKNCSHLTRFPRASLCQRWISQTAELSRNGGWLVSHPGLPGRAREVARGRRPGRFRRSSLE
jgi:SAM-dependent methyltransferase